MRKFLIIVLLLFGIGISNQYLAQSGGRKRERHNQRHRTRIKRHASAGHADQFAKGTGRTGLFSRLFRKERPAWRYKSSGSIASHRRANRNLFSRPGNKGRQYNADTQGKQNRSRSKRRIRGNKVFSSKKY